MARKCFGTKWYGDVPGHGVPKMVTPAMRTTAVLFSSTMTSGLASDSDKFKIIITLQRAQKFGDTEPYKNFDFLFNPLQCLSFFAILAKIYCPHLGTLGTNGLIKADKIVVYFFILELTFFLKFDMGNEILAIHI